MAKKGFIGRMVDADGPTKLEKVKRIKKLLERAGVLDDDTCKNCGSERMLCCHLVADPHKKENMIQSIKIDNMDEKHPIAIVCEDCGRVSHIVAQDLPSLGKGVSLKELKAEIE